MTRVQRSWSRAVLALLVTATGALPAAAVPISVSYVDGAGEGFNDPTLGAARRTAFQSALNFWANALGGSVPVVVRAHMDPLGGDAFGAVLGQAGTASLHRDFPGAPLASTFYSAALANQLSGSDVNGAALPEIDAVFNSDVDNAVVLGPVSWYYGTDANPSGHCIGGSNPGAVCTSAAACSGGSCALDMDFVSVVLHEVGHGLGFFDQISGGRCVGGSTPGYICGANAHCPGGTCDFTNAGAWLNGLPGIYDRKLVQPGVGQFDALTNAQRTTAIVSGNVFWNGSNVVAANGGNAKIYAPNPYLPGSSIAHWDTSFSPNQLMEPAYTGATRDLGLALQALRDEGWSASSGPAFTSTPTQTPTRTFTLASTSTPTPTRTLTQTPTATRTSTPTSTSTAASASTSTPTATRTPTRTLTSTPTPTSTPTWTPLPAQHDSVVRLRQPMTVIIGVGKPSVTKKVMVSVRNADILPPDTYPIQLQATSDCPVGVVVGTPDFHPTTPVAEDTIILAGGKSASAVVPVTIPSGVFRTFNAKAPRRCTLTFTATALVARNVDPTPWNNVLTVELNVIDKNVAEQRTVHESIIKSIAPTTVTFADGATANFVKHLHPVLGNADYRPTAEIPGHSIFVSVSAFNCPIAILVPQADPTYCGTLQLVKGGALRSCSLNLSLNPNGYLTPNRLSPMRCTATLRAFTNVSGNTEPDGTNNATKLTIDVTDRNDF